MSESYPSSVRRNPSRQGSSKYQSLPSIQENSKDLHISDEEPLSAGYHPDESVQRAAKNLSTPELRKKSGSSTGSTQKKNACAADPNNGRCLLTNLRHEAVQTCNLIAGSTHPNIVKQLEYAWGLPHGQFHLDTRHNSFFLRADWHHLFDQGKWMLVPELEVLKTLRKVTVDGAPEDRVHINLNQTFKRQTFKYHLLPLPGLQGPIRRFEDPRPDSVLSHATHRYPFISLGPLYSHIKPQYVVFNSAQKLGPISVAQLADLHSVLLQISWHRNRNTAVTRLQLIFDLYRHWTTLVIPDGFGRPGSGNKGGEGDADPPSAPSPSVTVSDEGNESGDDGESDNSGELSTPSKKPEHGRQYDDDDDDDVQSTSTTESMEGTVVDDNDWNSSEETSWIAEICGWAEHCTEAASKRGWETVLNDDQVAAYAKEPSCSAPAPESWHGWQPSWEGCEGKRRPFNTAKFSSNDWAVYEEHSYLTGTAL